MYTENAHKHENSKINMATLGIDDEGEKQGVGSGFQKWEWGVGSKFQYEPSFLVNSLQTTSQKKASQLQKFWFPSKS